MHKLFETIFEIFGWIRIVLSPLLIGLMIGAICMVIFFSKIQDKAIVKITE